MQASHAARPPNGDPESGAVHASNRPIPHTAHSTTHTAPRRHQAQTRQHDTPRWRSGNPRGAHTTQVEAPGELPALKPLLPRIYRRHTQRDHISKQLSQTKDRYSSLFFVTACSEAFAASLMHTWIVMQFPGMSHTRNADMSRYNLLNAKSFEITHSLPLSLIHI